MNNLVLRCTALWTSNLSMPNKQRKHINIETGASSWFYYRYILRRTALWTSNFSIRVVYHKSHMDGSVTEPEPSAERGRVLTARAMARPAAILFFLSFKIALYWSINLRIVYLWTGLGPYPYYSAGSPANDGAYTIGNLPIPRCSDRRNAGHSLRYLSSRQELYRCIGCQWYLDYFATASKWALCSLSFAELGSVRQDTCKW